MSYLDEIEHRLSYLQAKDYASPMAIAQLYADLRWCIQHLRIAQNVITQADIIAIEKRLIDENETIV